MSRNLQNYRKHNRTLYQYGEKYYRLHATGRTPNGCWLANPILVGLSDIDVADGRDVITGEVIHLDYGTASASNDYVFVPMADFNLLVRKITEVAP